MKKLITIITLTAAMVASALPTMAAVTVKDYSSTSIVDSYAGTPFIDRTSNINIRAGKANIISAEELNVIGSYVGTIINSGAKTITVEGHDIDVTTADKTNIVDSIVDTYLEDKTKVINVRELISKIKIKR